MATEISSVATLSTFIGLPIRIPLGVVSLAGASISRVTTVLTSKYQKKLTKVTKLVDIVTSAKAIFDMSVSKTLNNGEIDEGEFNMVQVLHLNVIITPQCNSPFLYQGGLSKPPKVFLQ